MALPEIIEINANERNSNSCDENTERINEIKEFFTKTYNASPEFYVRAPGRVNIIGEHVDYSGYSVLPMATRQDIFIAVQRRTDDKLCFANINSSYPVFQCDLNFVIDNIQHNWYKYMLCGLKGILDLCENSRNTCENNQISIPNTDCIQKTNSGTNVSEYIGIKVTGLNLAVYGSIPASVGLSSSSALVCASALVASHAWRLDLGLHELAELCAKSERFIGTEGGGMDQAASFLSKAGCAQLISFNPLHCTPVSLPPSATFVVANSLVEMNKAVGSEYNTRVCECRLACRILAKFSGLKHVENWQLGNLHTKLKNTFDEMIKLVEKFLHKEAYTKPELCTALDMSNEVFDKEILSSKTIGLTSFELYKRATHVFTEAKRVHDFKTICDQFSMTNVFQVDQLDGTIGSKSDETENSGSKLVHSEIAGSKSDKSETCGSKSDHSETSGSKIDESEVLRQLGSLMRESHTSCGTLYECSHPQMDKIVALSERSAFGARLTGAGWGGCVIALVDNDKVQKYIDTLKREYYKDHEVEDWSKVLFSTVPSRGACVYSVIHTV